MSTVFPLDGDYKLRWSPTATFGEDEDIKVLTEGNVPRGGYDVTVTFTIPEAKYGINYVQFLRIARDDPVNLQFSVLPSLYISPSSVTPGETVTITGSGFPDEDTCTLTFDGEAIEADVTSNETGSFTLDFAVPDTIAGEHKFTAEAQRLYTETSSITMEVVPSISLEPELPELGAPVTISGRGFAGNSVLSIKYDDLAIANSPSTDEAGNFTYEFNVPESSEKEHEITATDEAGNTSAYSLPLEGEAPSKPMPVTPKGQRFGLMGAETVAFKWTEVSDPSGITYTVEIGDNLNFFPLKPGMRKTDLTQPECVASLEPGTYYWRVRAIDGVGNEGEWSISPYAFKVGMLSSWVLIIGGIVAFLILIMLVRIFFRRLSEYYH